MSKWSYVLVFFGGVVVGNYLAYTHIWSRHWRDGACVGFSVAVLIFVIFWLRTKKW